jgi:hypothetical protein
LKEAENKPQQGKSFNFMKLLSLFFLTLSLSVQAQLSVTVSTPQVTGQKVVVSLAMTNQLAEPVESARAICFLLDGQGKMVGQTAKWVIGGSKDRPALEPKQGSIFNVVITSPQPLTSTNLTAKVTFSRIILAGGKLADVRQSVVVQR